MNKTKIWEIFCYEVRKALDSQGNHDYLKELLEPINYFGEDYCSEVLWNIFNIDSESLKLQAESQ